MLKERMVEFTCIALVVIFIAAVYFFLSYDFKSEPITPDPRDTFIETVREAMNDYNTVRSLLYGESHHHVGLHSDHLETLEQAARQERDRRIDFAWSNYLYESMNIEQ